MHFHQQQQQLVNFHYDMSLKKSISILRGPAFRLLLFTYDVIKKDGCGTPERRPLKTGLFRAPASRPLNTRTPEDTFCVNVCVCVCVCVFVCMCVRANRVFRDLVYRTFRYCEVIWYSEIPLPRSCSISTLSGGIAFSSPLAKFGPRPLNTCVIPPVFKSVLKTTAYSAIRGAVVT